MAFSDRARDFWDRISPRERKLVVFFTVAIPLALAIWLGLSIRDGLVSMEARNDQARDALEQLAKMKAAGGAQPEDPGIKIPDAPLSLVTYVSKAADKTQVKIKGSIDSRAVTKNGIVTTTVSCALEDISTDQLKAFMQEVETAEKIVAVTHLDVKRDRRDAKKIDATFEISTYSNAEKPKTEGDGDKKEKADEEKKEGG
ncbi:MAG: type II secretion system protein M [Deltaproteobacteria bacterium]|nr:type II secretion system protein M [Deltaproteobacteria bacterium]